ncbi:phosphoribosylanthranilate isomerase [Glacieibacterium frigidum]|uniref:N-(5'-phosphoribosyl)anthranilate isomerase n=1 Tax=Glacieibacterium frigidum TaxID=2593303 RepID=A0A552UHR6_9SPHN|nr:phosphoribosylanthranilate isomerase [Glacieibacterium frigidum]TRW17766.1 phosphoribosylanthranilate isomerase [Glacieibacterium frigidum]
MRTRIKICCIASPAEAALAVDHGADAVGLVAAMPSGPGPIDDALIAAIAATVPPPVASVLLTSESDAQAIAAHVTRTRPAAVQIVRHIAPAESAALARLLPLTRRIQVIHVEDAGVIDLIPAYAPHVDAFLLDSGRPGAATPTLGGTGDVHDWAVSAAFVAASPRPVFLAGGLNAGNVGAAIAQVRPFGVDICSGVRTDGALDPDKLAAFVAAVAAADYSRSNSSAI